jgi:hypothetical protein
MTWRKTKPSVDLKNPELRAYLVDSYVDFGVLAHEIIGKLIERGVREPFILEAVANATVNQPIVYRVEEFYAQPAAVPITTKLTPEQEKRAQVTINKLVPQIGQKAHQETKP